jgi:hypothetical protein
MAVAARDRPAYSAPIVGGSPALRTTAMLKNAESIFFLLATVAALALPAVPFVQEALYIDESLLEAAAPVVTMEPVIVRAEPDDIVRHVAQLD